MRATSPTACTVLRERCGGRPLAHAEAAPGAQQTDSERSFVCCRLTSAESSVAVYSGAQWMIGTSFRQGPAACAR